MSTGICDSCLHKVKQDQKENMKKKIENKAVAEVLPTAKQATELVNEGHAKVIHDLGKVVIDRIIDAGTATLNLCEFIRKNSVSPKLVSHELAELGFSRSWASKVNKVAQCSNEAWDAFKARTLTMKDILSIGQGEALAALAVEMGQSSESIKAQVEEMETEEAENPELVQPTEKELKEKRKKQNEKAYATLIRNFRAEKNWRKFTLTVDEFKFTVSKVSARKSDAESSPETAEA